MRFFYFYYVSVILTLKWAADSTKRLMTRLQVKSVPSFLIFKHGQMVSAWTGANKTGFRNQIAPFVSLQ